MTRSALSLNLDDARPIIAADELKATEIGTPYNIADTDAGGGLVAHVVMSKLRESGRGRISHPRLWRAGSSHQSCLRSSRRPARRFPDFRSPSTANSRARRQTIANQSRCITFQEVSSCISYS